MNKRITKIICATVSATFILGAALSAGCSNYYGSQPLAGDISGEISSNGGFAVEKGNYIYYINGIGSNTSENSYGTPVKGAIYRVSKDNLKARNYSSVDKVVPQISYSSHYNAGIFIYGDRIYYGTPSNERNSEGVVQNSVLDMKSSKLDGTETLKEAYVQFPSASYEYRYVEENDTVYLLYVATDEKLFDESTGVKNLHSYNTATGANTLLAYNVGDVTFDSSDKTNSRVYYTMSVYDYNGSSNTAYEYNQLYTVKADATVDKFAGKLSANTVQGWNDNPDNGTVDRYVNCGDLVLDGMGYGDYLGNSMRKTVFNYMPDDPTVAPNIESYTYTVEQYVNDTVYYTRTTKYNDSAYLFSLGDDEEKKPFDNNVDISNAILSDGAEAENFIFVNGKDGNPAVIRTESEGGISINYFVNGKLGTDLSDVPAPVDEPENTYFPIVRKKKGSATILTVDGNYLYYSLSGGNGYTVYRVDYTGALEDYPDRGNDKFASVKLLDLDASSSWYKPEIIDNYLLFASSTTNMTSYNYIMLFDLHKEGGEVMSNPDIKELNELYEGVENTIKDVFGDTDNYPTKQYANVQNVLRYAFYNGDYDYLTAFAKELNDALDEDEDLVYSEQTFDEYAKFVDPTSGENNVWADGYTASKTVNGKKVYANNREYYYSILGEMSSEDGEAYGETLKTAYLVSKPEEEPATGWYEGLSTVEKAFFIIGMCLIGAVVIGGGVWLTIFLLRRKKKGQPEPRRRRIKVDTTDDKDIDVYNYEE